MDYMQKSNGSSRDVMVKDATQGAFALAGGVGMLILQGLSGIPVLGAIIGGALLIAGLGMRSRASGKEKTSANVLAGIGGLSLAAGITALLPIPLIGGIAAVVMSITGWGLMGFGAWKLWKFYKSYKDRNR